MVGALSRGLLLAALYGLLVSAASGAAITPGTIHRMAVDETRYPWSAVGKLFNEGGSACSGVLVSREKILTAAHCLFNYRTRRFISASALHFLVGYHTGRYAAHVRIVRYDIGAGFDPLRYDKTSDHDWAVLTVTERLPESIEPLRLRRDAAPSGTRAVLVGYPQDRAFAMTVDGDCELGGRTDGGRLLLHTCRGTKGYSGAPILVGTGGDMQIAGIQIATLRSDGVVRMLAVSAQNILFQIDDDGVRSSDQTSAVCRADDSIATMALADVQDSLSFIPATWSELDADPFEIVASAPARRDILRASAMAWLAMEPFALPAF